MQLQPIAFKMRVGVPVRLQDALDRTALTRMERARATASRAPPPPSRFVVTPGHTFSSSSSSSAARVVFSNPSLLTSRKLLISTCDSAIPSYSPLLPPPQQPASRSISSGSWRRRSSCRLCGERTTPPRQRKWLHHGNSSLVSSSRFSRIGLGIFMGPPPSSAPHDTVNRVRTSAASARRRLSTSSSNEAAGNESPRASDDSAIAAQIRDLIRAQPVVLFMKGTPDEPLCGFSAQVIKIFDMEEFEDYTFVDVLKSDTVREAVKEIGDWDTVPQVYIKGEFVGGAQILLEMHASGELKELLGKAKLQQGEDS